MGTNSKLHMHVCVNLDIMCQIKRFTDSKNRMLNRMAEIIRAFGVPADVRIVMKRAFVVMANLKNIF